MSAVDYSKPWYHGSPLRVTMLRAGSIITQDRSLARIFSHEPTFVSIDEGGLIKHNGKAEGFLYVISGKVETNDVTPRPDSRMESGKEWLTLRPLEVRLIGPTRIVRGEVLSEAEIAMLRKILEGQQPGKLRPP
jgi:hypothetical protein